MALDAEGSKNAFNHIKNLWVIPEVELRNQRGSLDTNFILHSAQVLLDPERVFWNRL
jgi:hypothetical protein